jgi:hypothetical protein
MKYRSKYEAYGQEHDDIWLGAKSKSHVEQLLMEICPTVNIHEITKTEHDEQTELNAAEKGSYNGVEIFAVRTA